MSATFSKRVAVVASALTATMVALAFGRPALAPAQADPGAATSPGAGWPRLSFLNFTGSPFPPTPAERATVVSRLNTIDSLVRKVGAMARPQGFEAGVLEKTEWEVGENLKASESAEREDDQRLLATPTIGDRLRSRLAAMSQTERAEPA